MAGLIPIGSLTAASDLTTAALIVKPASAMQEAIDRQVVVPAPNAAAEFLASDPGVGQRIRRGSRSQLEILPGVLLK